jgi:arylsulfatase A-like enzyme
MEDASSSLEQSAPPAEPLLSPWFALVLAAAVGLVGGYLDLAMIVLKRDAVHATLYYEQSRHFVWTVPLSSLLVMLIPGVLIAVANGLKRGLFTARSALWVYATLALWGPLLRAPLYGLATLLLAAGAGRSLSRRSSRRPDRLRRFALAGVVLLAGIVVVTAATCLAREAAAERRALARLPAPPSQAKNVLLIVMDTVRAANLGLYGYDRDTTPELARWARRGVRFDWAVAPAPWTFPSHCSFMTGQWPSTLNAHWEPTLDPAYPTIAESLAARGYLTAGFAANTAWCSYESGMNRGFAHYEDYPLTTASIFATSMPGLWLMKNVLRGGDAYSAKWLRFKSRDGRAINSALLRWLDGIRGGGRPFFAFLNYFDAHDPFIPPTDSPRSFGRRPRSRAEFQMLLDYWDRDKSTLSESDVELARDSYDNCITALDRHIGDLLDALEQRGALRNTLVIIASDHGEEFGEHGVFNHGFSLYAHEVHVPLLVIDPTLPAGARIAKPVSLRALPATVVDLLGLDRGSTFPGRSLARFWRRPDIDLADEPSSAYSEVYIPLEPIPPQRGRGPKQRGFAASIVAENRHYIVDLEETEELFDLGVDPLELRDVKGGPELKPVQDGLRKSVVDILLQEPRGTGKGGARRKELAEMLGRMLAKPPQ